MKWSEIKFYLLSDASNTRVALRGNQMCGMILTLDATGVERAASVGKSFEFDLDPIGQLKFFKGNAHVSDIALPGYPDQATSKVKFDSVHLYLWVNPVAEQMLISANFSYILLIDKAGVRRFKNASGCGIPCDELGRVKVIR